LIDLPSFSSVSPDEDLFSVVCAVDRFVDDCESPFEETPLSIRDIENLTNHRTLYAIE
jgi:hypothetical protein